MNQNVIIALVLGALALFTVAFLTIKEVNDDGGGTEGGSEAQG